MFRWIQLPSILLAITFCSLAFSQDKGGTRDGGGGGIIVRDGVPYSFSDAGIKQILKRPNPLTEVPGLKKLVSNLKQLEFGGDGVLRDIYKTQLIENIEISEHRNYFKISDLPPNLQDELDNIRQENIKKYRKILEDQESLSILKGDDTVSVGAIHISGPLGVEGTYLYDEFFDLEKDGPAQQAILFVEDLRIINKNISWADAARAQILYQAWLKKGRPSYGPTLFRLLGKVFQDGYLDIRAALAYDKTNKIIPKFPFVIQIKDNLPFPHYVMQFPTILGFAASDSHLLSPTQMQSKISSKLRSLAKSYPESQGAQALFYAKNRIYFCFADEMGLYLPSQKLANKTRFRARLRIHIPTHEKRFSHKPTTYYQLNKVAKLLRGGEKLIEKLPNKSIQIAKTTTYHDHRGPLPIIFILPELDLNF